MTLLSHLAKFISTLPELAPCGVAPTGCRDINGPIPPSLSIRVLSGN